MLVAAEGEMDPCRRFNFNSIKDPTSESNTCLANSCGMCCNRHLMDQQEIFTKYKRVNGDLDILTYQRVMTTYLPTEEAREDTLNALNSSFIQQSREE